VSGWAVEEFRALRLEEIDVRYARYRLSVLEAEETMSRSLRRYGQISPVVVCLREEVPVLIDGFKRLTAAFVLEKPREALREAQAGEVRGWDPRLSAAGNRVSRQLALLLDQLARIEHLQGAAATCLYDNMKVVVARYEDGEPIYNTRFLAFATHYGFRPVACRPRRPQTKGKVERPFLYIEKNLLSGREFRSLEHLNEVTAWWLAEVADVREHRQTRRRPTELHAEELPHLIPLPERPYEVAEMVYRTVDAEGFVSYGNHRYSVPWQFLGQVLPVRITDDAVAISSPRLEVLARHVRFPPTERHRTSRLPEHLPPRDLVRRREVLRERFAEMGPLAVRFLEGLLAAQRCGWDHAQKVLTLWGIYRREDLLAALERAVRYGAFSAKSIERILAVQARPKTCWDRMAEEEPSHLGDLLSDDPTPPRPATEYQNLLFEEPDDDDQAKEKDDTSPEDSDQPF
jgi:hypothetical protein